MAAVAPASLSIVNSKVNPSVSRSCSNFFTLLQDTGSGLVSTLHSFTLKLNGVSAGPAATVCIPIDPPIRVTVTKTANNEVLMVFIDHDGRQFVLSSQNNSL
jgi:hypothetical protein